MPVSQHDHDAADQPGPGVARDLGDRLAQARASIRRSTSRTAPPSTHRPSRWTASITGNSHSDVRMRCRPRCLAPLEKRQQEKVSETVEVASDDVPVQEI